MNVWLNCWNFSKNPKDQKDANQKTSFKLKQVISILVLDIIVVTVISFMIGFVEEMGWVSTESHQMNELFKTTSIWIILLLGVFIVPFFGELIFRLYLRKKYNPIRLVSCIAGMVKSSSKADVNTLIDRKWHTYYKPFFYGATLLFALVHITNYELTVTILIFTPLLVAPQFFAGLFMGYLRVKFGLLWGMLLHFSHNLLFLGIAIIFVNKPVESFYIENEDYQLKVEESGFRNSNSMMNSFDSDTIVFDNVKFKAMMAQLLETEEVFIEILPERTHLENVSFNFKALKDSLDAKSLILAEIKKAFNFEVLKTNQIQESWVVTIADKDLLYKHLSDSLDNTVIINKSNRIELEKVNLERLVNTLNSNYDEFIFSELELQDSFRFNLKKKDFETLKQELSSNYGLQLEKKSTNVEKITIQFKE